MGCLHVAKTVPRARKGQKRFDFKALCYFGKKQETQVCKQMPQKSVISLQFVERLCSPLPTQCLSQNETSPHPLRWGLVSQCVATATSVQDYLMTRGACGASRIYTANKMMKRMKTADGRRLTQTFHSVDPDRTKPAIASRIR
jgi:hypothetical protein